MFRNAFCRKSSSFLWFLAVAQLFLTKQKYAKLPLCWSSWTKTKLEDPLENHLKHFFVRTFVRQLDHFRIFSTGLPATSWPSLLAPTRTSGTQTPVKVDILMISLSPTESSDQGPMLWSFKYFRRIFRRKNCRFWLETKLHYAKIYHNICFW
jgi:hypothetical protein